MNRGFVFTKVTLAAVQAPSVFLDRSATIDVVSAQTAQAAQLGADLVAFPEAFVPGFPTWALVLRPTDQHELTGLLYEQAVEVPGVGFAELGSIAAENGVVLSVGVTERSTESVGTMWNTNLLFGSDGELLNHRRKLIPTWAEKLVWANGDASGLHPVETSIGRIGALICGENTNPLARFAMIERGEQIHIATHPSAWPTRRDEGRGDYDLGHAVRLRSAAHSFEGKVTTVTVSGLVSDDEMAAIENADATAAEALKRAPQSVSAITGPDGKVVVDPLVGDSGLLVATIDLSDSIHVKKFHDVSGGYQRFDIFDFTVNRRRRHPGDL